MIAPFQGDDVPLRRLAAHVEIEADQTQRGVHRIRSAEREEHVVEITGCKCGELGGEQDCRLGAIVEIAGGVGQPAHLLGRGAYDALLPVADIDTPQAGEAIEQRLPLDVGQHGPLPGAEDGDAARLVTAQRNDGMDQMVVVKQLQ